ncbi:MAG: phosphoribosylformylglycinamidine synthase subunit PurL [Planctomycetota bacterium]|jgi:phosphoribosylformylglycinamidine synthase II|nr:phosphoribosylformylglycinamidine synthase subunit PurL [Planctomycetota bacterium]
MLWEVDVSLRDAAADPLAREFVAGAATVDRVDLSTARTAVGWLLEGPLSRTEVERIAAAVLVDPVTESCQIDEPIAAGLTAARDGLPTVVHVLPKPGVTDPAGLTAAEALAVLGHPGIAVRSLRKYWLPPMEAADARELARRLVANEAIHEVVIGPLSLRTLAGGGRWEFSRPKVSLEGLDDAALGRLSRERCLALSAAELAAVRDHFRTLGRDPAEIELETIAQTWSEHCCHKTLTSPVEHEGPAGRVAYDNLLKETVFAATQTIRRSLGAGDWCVSVFRDNSGVVRFDGDHDICVKVETHNHPSAIEPYGGAATGLGGVIRDVLGTGLAARPIANLDVFCVAPLDTPTAEIPPGVIPPRRLLAGVVAGVRDYGNRMGIPTIAGAVAFDPGYLGNPLVFCGTVGIMPRGHAEAAPAVGDLVVVAGGRTGRDGIHGATFSSIELSSDSETESGGAVQIGHAIHEKTLTEFVLEAARQDLFHAITDCGAGGLSSAVGEMAATLGAEVDLDRVPLKYAGLSATEVWISEAQERMVLAVPPEAWERIAAIAAAEGVEATAIGRFTGDGRLTLRWEGQRAGELDCHFLHEGRPRQTLSSTFAPAPETPARWQPAGLAATLTAVLALPDVASKEWIIRQYDHEVQGASVTKPLLGPGEGPADGTVIRGVLGRDRGVVLAVGLRHRLGPLDAYQMAAGGIVEAIANAVAAGADPERIALLDNFCWGDTRRPETLGPLVEACRGCHDAAIAFAAPFVSGKDSLNNVFAYTDGEGQSHEISIPPTLLATALGQVPAVGRSMSPDLKRAGSLLAVVGISRPDTAGSQLELTGRVSGGRLPAVDLDACRATIHAVARAAHSGTLLACHDLSDGGLAAGLAEMAIGGGLGARLELNAMPFDDAGLDLGAAIGPSARDLAIAFGESPGRFLCELPAGGEQAFAAAVGDVPWAIVGEVVAEPVVELFGTAGKSERIAVGELAAAWRSLARENT